MSNPQPRDAKENLLLKIRIPLMQRGFLSAQGRTDAVFVLDLGAAGVFVESKDRLPDGEIVDLHFTLPGNAIPIEIKARVAWWHPEGSGTVSRSLPAGMGLAFVEVSSADQERIFDHLRAYLQRNPGARRFSRPWLGDDEPKGR